MGSSWFKWGAMGALFVALLLPAPAVVADDGGVLIKMLDDGHSFRVRARAALALGRVADDAATAALERALRDPHAAVRAAAASALGRVGARRSVPALRAATADRSGRVAGQAKEALRQIARRQAAAGEDDGGALVQPAAPVASIDQRVMNARRAIVLGEVRDESGRATPELTALLQERMRHELSRLPHVAVFSLDEMHDGVTRRLEVRRVKVFRMEATLKKMEPHLSSTTHSVRAEVSLLLLDEPERVMRSMLRGAATGVEEPRGSEVAQRRLLARKAISSAVRSAVSNAAEAIDNAAAKRELGPASDIRAAASLN
jgi:hypothetical protein